MMEQAPDDFLGIEGVWVPAHGNAWKRAGNAPTGLRNKKGGRVIQPPSPNVRQGSHLRLTDKPSANAEGQYGCSEGGCDASDGIR